MLLKSNSEKTLEKTLDNFISEMSMFNNLLLIHKINQEKKLHKLQRLKRKLDQQNNCCKKQRIS